MSQMQGTITRDVVVDVMNEVPELLVSQRSFQLIDVPPSNLVFTSFSTLSRAQIIGYKIVALSRLKNMI